ncbi:CRISPR-associated protein Cas4 [Thermosediminibacter litoriperuensis]|uniref:CRISPR-associated protein Cas4 n=1 Tax=Thermosediminibacter litoriperuensis TaxID=291989 RepID=UPI0011E68EB6
MLLREGLKVSGKEINITGTLVWYYFICPRQVWLMSHNINPDEDDENVAIGRFLHQESYARERKEISFHGGKVDVLGTRDGQIVVAEIKKSKKAEQSARMQLAFYLYELRKLGIEAKGELRYIEEKRKEQIVLDEQLTVEVENAMVRILRLMYEPVPPKPQKIRWCSNCAYKEFCWA